MRTSHNAYLLSEGQGGICMVCVVDICPWSPRAPYPLPATVSVFVWGFAPPTLEYCDLGGPPLWLPHMQFGTSVRVRPSLATMIGVRYAGNLIQSRLGDMLDISWEPQAKGPCFFTAD